MAAPTLDQLREWLGLPEDDHLDDAVLQASLDAALTAQAVACAYPLDDFGDPLFTADLTEAVYIRSMRYAARRNSPEGVLGLGSELGFTSARIPSFDADVLHLEGPYRRIVVA